MARFTTKFPTPLFSKKNGNNLDIIEFLPPSFSLIQVDDAASDLDWVFVAKFFNDIVGARGWVERKLVVSGPDVAPSPDIDLETFTEEVISVEYVFNRQDKIAPFFIDADFILALANIETGIKNLVGLGLMGERIGPFALNETEWADFLASGFAPVGFDPLDIGSPLHQVDCAAYMMHLSAKTLSALQAAAGNGSADDPYLPRLGELLRCRFIGAQRTFDMQEKLKNGSGDEPLPDFFAAGGMDIAEIKATLDFRCKFMRMGGIQSGDPLTLKGFHDKCAATLNTELSAAFELIKKHVPEAIETPSQSGQSPWMTIARAELAAKISEGDVAGRQKIATYFTATGFNGNADDKWCGAFVAWCMQQSGDEGAESYAAIKNRAASAAAWREWGDVDINLKNSPPVGAVVLLSPSRETDDVSHVGFFKSYDDDQRMVTILGGNQSNKVCEVPFKAADVVAIRWKNLLAAQGAVQIIPGAPIPAGREDIAAIIVNEFARAGYGRIQQIAALANAIKESSLNPTARGDGSLSIGLFQCHTTKGAGIGHRIGDLEDPTYNAGVIIGVANKYGKFADASTIEKAVDIFVRYVERPKHKEAEIADRTKIAKKLAALLP